MDSRSQYERKFYRLSSLSNFLEFVALAIAALSAATYLKVEYALGTPNHDTTFVVLLLMSTAVLVLGERHTRRHFLINGLEFFAYSMDAKMGPDVFREHNAISIHLYRSRDRIVSGISYGALLGGGAYALDVWPANHELRVLLSSFLFAVNYITGNAIYTLVRFLWDSKELSRIIKIDVWNSRNPSTEFYVRSILQVALFACVYVSVSMTSILFSRFDKAAIVYIYIAFSFSMMMIALVYPYVPIVHRLAIAKRELQYRIGRRLHVLTDEILQSAGRPEADASLEEMRRLMELRKSVDDVDILPFRSVSVSVVAIMAFVFSHPLLLEWAMKAHVVADALKTSSR